MSWPYPGLPPDSRAVGTGNPPQDVNQLVDYVTALTSRVGKTIYDPRDYGAVGDGVTDDTAAINNCIAATPALGAMVNVGMAPVSYAISSPITLKQGCTMVGSWVNAPAVASHLDITTLASFSGLAALADSGALYTGPTNTVGAGSNGGTLSGIAAWATPSAGVLSTGSAVITGAGGFPATGQLQVVTSGGIGRVAYTGVSGSSFTGCTYVSGTGTTVATGAAITGTSPTSSFPISLVGVSLDLTSCPVPANTVGAGSNGGTLSGIAAWATPSAGVLSTGSALTGFPPSGQVVVQTSAGTAMLIYTGISGSSLTGCVYVPGSGSSTGTVATGGTITVVTDAIRLQTYGAWVLHCMTKQAPGCGLRFTDANAGGFAITNSAVENRVENCSFVRSGVSGIATDNFTAALTDGYCVNNIVQHKSVATGQGSDSTGPAFDFEYSADWQIRGNHAYACPQDAYVIKNSFGTFFDGNDADNFGTAGLASTTYHGVYFTNQLAGPASTITSNDIQDDESHGAASTVYEYYHIGGTSGQTGFVTMVGNHARQQTSGPGTSKTRSFAGNGGTLNLYEVATTIASPATSPTISAVNTLAGTVNLLKPGATAMNSGAISVPLGVSSTYGTSTTLLTPLIPGSGLFITGIQTVWGGTFATDTVNIQLTGTFDDGSTATVTGANATVASTVLLQPAQFLNLAKAGRQLVQLSVQARTNQASTSVTCSVQAGGTAA